MNSINFIKEVKESNICPENFDEIYNEFQIYQNDALNTLYEFHRVCEKNKIPYVVHFGSLLGLIRDGGQIPWDYDVDVAVPFNEKEKLIQALEKDLNTNFYYFCIEKNNKCRHMIMRLAPKGYKTESLHVDVFYYIGTPNDERERKKFAKRIKNLSFIRFYKYVDISEAAYGNIKRKIKYSLLKILVKFININKVMDEYNDLCNKYNVYDSEYNISADCFALAGKFKSKDLWKTKLKKTADNHELRIPVAYEKILVEEYGDYKKIFPLQNRLNEMMGHYKKLHRQNCKLISQKKDIKKNSNINNENLNN